MDRSTVRRRATSELVPELSAGGFPSTSTSRSTSAAAGPRSAAALRCTTRTRAASPRRTPSGTSSARPIACPTSLRRWARCPATGWRDPAAVPGSRHRAGRDLPDGRRRRPAVAASWAGCAGIPAGRCGGAPGHRRPTALPTCANSAPAAAAAAPDRCRRRGRQGIRPWAEVLEHASPRYTPAGTAAGDRR
jgi:hypothetical protein